MHFPLVHVLLFFIMQMFFNEFYVRFRLDRDADINAQKWPFWIGPPAYSSVLWHHFLPGQVGILWRIKEYWSGPVATSMFQIILLKAEVMTRKLKSFDLTKI